MVFLICKIGDVIKIGDDVIVTITTIHRGKVKIGITAPMSIAVHRMEVYKRLHANGQYCPAAKGE